MADDKSILEPPSYSDSVFLSFSNTSSDSIIRLSQNRTLHINATIDRFLAPVVDGRLSRGLNSSTIALIPTSKNIQSNPFVHHDFKTIPSEIIGLASDHDLDAQFDMTDIMDSKEFWMQTEVITELEQNIGQRWCSSVVQSDGLIFREKAGITENLSLTSQPHASNPRPKSLFSRLSSKQPRVETTHQEFLRKVEIPQRDFVKVKLDEICFRTVNSFGLYETIVKPAVIVSINITH